LNGIAKLIADNGARREPAKPTFCLAGDITTRKFDARQYVTERRTRHPRHQDVALL
jgi:hypothetical protein